uniref:Uncharacterized protein n=2 Tax=Caenorhabditis japonica TaxID=281687 RepID=A0A8R1DG74_CAEJA
MRIKLDHMNGWFIDLAFTKDSRFRTENKIEYTVFQVNITANFSSDPAAFPDSKYPTQNYYLQVKPNLPSDIANAMQVSENLSYYCPSEQKYVVNSDKNVGPYAYILFKRTTMQAFMGSSILGSKETCSTDQHPIDFVTIIISSALSGLLALVLTVYLVYQHVFSKNVLISANSDSENKPNQEAMDESFSVHL